MPSINRYAQYLGGADNLLAIEMLPAETHTFTYRFKPAAGDTADISTWTVDARYRSLLANDVTAPLPHLPPTFNGFKGVFGTSSKSVPPANISPPDNTSKTFKVTIPPNRYEGFYSGSETKNLIVTIVSVTVTEPGEGATSTVGEVSQHRFAIIERAGGGVSYGNPEQNDTGEGHLAYTPYSND